MDIISSFIPCIYSTFYSFITYLIGFGTFLNPICSCLLIRDKKAEAFKKKKTRQLMPFFIFILPNKEKKKIPKKKSEKLRKKENKEKISKKNKLYTCKNVRKLLT
jgi:hypothetical protein